MTPAVAPGTAPVTVAAPVDLPGALQKRILDRMWERPEMAWTVAEMQAAINAGPSAPLAYTTVLCVLRSLVRRGLCSREMAPVPEGARGGRGHAYRVIVPREALAEAARAYVAREWA